MSACATSRKHEGHKQPLMRLASGGKGIGTRKVSLAHQQHEFDCGWCATLFNKVDWIGRKCFAATKKGPSETMHIGCLGARGGMGKTMFRSTQFRFAVIALFAVAAIPADYCLRTGIQSGEQRRWRGRQFDVC